MENTNKYKFMIIHPAGGSHRQFHFSKWVGRVCVLAGLLLLVVTGILVEDYLCLRNKSAKYRELKKQIAKQNDEILQKQKQIELFTGKIDVLKSNIVGLKKLENEIKTLANLKKGQKKRNNKAKYGGSETLFGMGGSYDQDVESLDSLKVSPDGLAREINNQVEDLYLASINQKQSLEELLDSLKDRENLLACRPTIKPCRGYISSTFGYRESPFKNSREFHKGIDISENKGTKISATGDGVVTFTGRDGLFGNMVIVDHGYGLVTKYAHMNKIVVNKGSFVKKGKIIGHMGNTGRTTGSHLHYEVLLNGIHVNPLNYINN
ncbi:MAG: peptidoglycan DD-metalloendopeptidase family protein [Proteobacteria bacterium]|nr:peptidoglycan DD-metalloendopeptidase family protein [Pseudomonadota bacterium]